jgi:cell division transport system ATP-binding protein
MREKAADALAAVGLAWKLEVPPRRLSAGEQQRVAIARALVGEPAILLADEPTGNLDPQLTQDLLLLFTDVHRRGTTILLATHDLQIMLAGERAGLPRAHLTTGKIAVTAAVPPDENSVVLFPMAPFATAPVEAA